MDPEATPAMILVMGMTGTGKSYFINKLVKDKVKEGHELFSETQLCEPVLINICGSIVTLVDTPGFDDTTRSDSEILDIITSFLCCQYQCQIPLKGILFLHRITDNRMTGTAQRYLEIVQKMCGTATLKNVFLVTTQWNQLRDKSVGVQRERTLRQTFWRPMLNRQSALFRFEGSVDEAEGIIMQMLTRPDCVLDIQRQLFDDGIPLGETEAGKLMIPAVEMELDKTMARLEELNVTSDCSGDASRTEARKKELEVTKAKHRSILRVRERFKQNRLVEGIKDMVAKQKAEFNLKTGFQIFCSVVGVALAIAGFCCP